MGIGKAAVYKHIPEYFPHDVGAVGGLVGMLGALGGFFLPPLFAYTTGWTALPQSTFFVLFVLTAIAAIWMHMTVIRSCTWPHPSSRTSSSTTTTHRWTRKHRRRHRRTRGDWSQVMTTPTAPDAPARTGSRSGTRRRRTGTPAAPGRRCGSRPSR